MERVEHALGVRQALLHAGVDPFGAVAGDRLDGGALLVGQLSEEQVEDLLAVSVVRPDDPSALVVDDHGDVRVRPFLWPVSSTPIAVRPSNMHGIEDPNRAATLRAMSPAVLHAMRRNPPTVFRLATAVSHARSISQSLVDRLPGSAHGTWATATPCSARATRGAKPMARPHSGRGPGGAIAVRRPRRRIWGTCARNASNATRPSCAAPGPPGREPGAAGNRPPTRPRRPCP